MMDTPTKPLDDSRDSTHDADELKHRLQRLEDAIASLNNIEEIEERIVQRIVHPTHTAEREVPPTQKHAVAEAPAVDKKIGRLPWLFVDVIAEMRATFRMFFDVTYHVAWSTRIIAIGLLFLVFTSGWWFAFANIPVVGTLIDKLVCVLLSYVAFKALNREARRYMEWRKNR